MSGKTLVTATGKHETFGHIIFACRMDNALHILEVVGQRPKSKKFSLHSTGEERRLATF